MIEQTTVDYQNPVSGERCRVILFQDGSAAVDGDESYIIEGGGDSLARADELLKEKGYKKFDEHRSNGQST